MVVTGVGAWPQPRTQDGLDRRVASPQPQLLHLPAARARTPGVPGGRKPPPGLSRAPARPLSASL